MTKKTKAWWVSQTHMYSRQVGELRDMLEKEASVCAKYRYEASCNHRMVESVTARSERCADIIETLVNALAQHEGHDELLKDARLYLNLLVNGQEIVTPFEDYFAWRDRQRGE